MKRIASLLLIIALIFSFQTPAWAAEAETEQLPTAYPYAGKTSSDGPVQGIYRVNTDQGSKGVSFATFADALKAIELGKVSYCSRGNTSKDLDLIKSASSYGWSTTPETATFYVSTNGSETSFTIDGDLEIKKNICFNNAFDTPTTINFTGKITISNGGALEFTRVISLYNTVQPISVQFSNPVIVKSGGRLVIQPSKDGNNVTNDKYELTNSTGSLFQIESGASASIDRVSMVTPEGNTDPIISTSGSIELGGSTVSEGRQMYSGPNTVVAVQEGGSLTLKVAEFHTTGENSAITVANNATIEFNSDTLLENDKVPVDQITADNQVAINLSAGAAVKKDDVVNVVVSTEQSEAGENYVDNNGNIILAKGAKKGGTPLEAAAVILADGTLVEGSGDEAPEVTYDTNEDGATVTKVTVPAGGRVTAPDGTVTPMESGGIASSDGTGTEVMPNQPKVTGVTLDKTSLTLYSNSTPNIYKLTATITPADAANKAVTWTSSDEKVATVENGVVTAVGDGTATITATAGSVSATCTVTVKTYSSGSGSSSSDYDEPTYSVSLPSRVTGGSAKVSPRYAEKGDTVTITVTPDEGYELDEIIVTDKKGDELKVKDKGNGKFTFTMPASKVSISVRFVEAEEEVPTPVTSPSEAFIDLDADAWYREAADFVLSNGMMDGNGAGMFLPYTELNRGMMARVLYNMENKPAFYGSNAFSDVASGTWYTDAVNWAAANKIVSGNGGGLFLPDVAITREGLAVILYNYASYKGYNVDPQGNLSVFTDGAETSPWARNAMEWAVGCGLISGKGGSTLDPKGTATRIEVAQLLMNFCEAFSK